MKILVMCLAFLLSTLGAFALDAGHDHTTLPLRCWTPMLPPRFALLCIHGLGLNSNSYADFAKRANRFGGIVYALDVRGFGAWKEDEQHDKVDFDATLADIKSALQQIHTAHPSLPVFMLGESMGGAIALRATSMYPDMINGLISCVPAAERFQTKKTDLKVALELLKGPNHEFNIGKQIVKQAATADRINDDGKKVKVINEKLATSWEDDPLNRMKLSAKELLQFQAFMNDNHDAVKKITDVPVLFVQGLDDQLVKPEGTFELAQEVGTPYRMFVAFPTRHLVFEETQASDPRINRASTQVVMAWINTHILGAEPITP
jgi:alpha-beta hydrolase superfamily lysophospholipase